MAAHTHTRSALQVNANTMCELAFSCSRPISLKRRHTADCCNTASLHGREEKKGKWSIKHILVLSYHLWRSFCLFLSVIFLVLTPFYFHLQTLFPILVQRQYMCAFSFPWTEKWIHSSFTSLQRYQSNVIRSTTRARCLPPTAVP
jgi:hypothetical protein